MFKKINNLKRNLNHDQITLIFGLIAWIFVIGSLPFGEPVPIYAGY